MKRSPLPAQPAAPEEPAPTKRDAIVGAGASVFLEEGFGSASMDEIARRAAVSKATIYSHFESKHELFGAIVTGRCQAMIPEITDPMLDERAPADALRMIGRRFLDLLLSPNPLSLYRVVLSEAPRFPELGRSFYDAGPNRVAAALAEYLARQSAQGVLAIADPRLAAEQFFGMVLGQNHIRMLLAITDAPPGPEERDRIVETAVQTFLNGVAVRSL